MQAGHPAQLLSLLLRNLLAFVHGFEIQTIPLFSLRTIYSNPDSINLTFLQALMTAASAVPNGEQFAIFKGFNRVFTGIPPNWELVYSMLWLAGG